MKLDDAEGESAEIATTDLCSLRGAPQVSTRVPNQNLPLRIKLLDKHIDFFLRKTGGAFQSTVWCPQSGSLLRTESLVISSRAPRT